MLKEHSGVFNKIKKCIYHINMGDCSDTYHAQNGVILSTNGGGELLTFEDLRQLGRIIEDIISNANTPPRAPDLFDAAISALKSRMREKYDKCLREKEHSWADMRASDLFGLLSNEFHELDDALCDCDRNAARNELVDIANFCAMLLNRLEG